MPGDGSSSIARDLAEALTGRAHRANLGMLTVGLLLFVVWMNRGPRPQPLPKPDLDPDAVKYRVLLGERASNDNATLDPVVRTRHFMEQSVDVAFQYENADRAAGRHPDVLEDRTNEQTECIAVPNVPRVRVDLVIGVPAVDASPIMGLEMDTFRPMSNAERLSDDPGLHMSPSVGLAHASAEARYCGLCTVTIVRPVVNGTMEPFADDTAAQAFYESTFVRGAKPVDIDARLCGFSRRRVRHVVVPTDSEELWAWQGAVFEAVDRVVDLVSRQKTLYDIASSKPVSDPVVAYIDAASPPDATLDNWITALVYGNESGYFSAFSADAATRHDDIRQQVREWRASSKHKKATATSSSAATAASSEAADEEQQAAGGGGGSVSSNSAAAASDDDDDGGVYDEVESLKAARAAAKFSNKWKFAPEEYLRKHYRTTPPKAPARITDGVLYGCPKWSGYGGEDEGARDFTRNAARIESFGFEVAMSEALGKPVLHRKFAGLPRFHRLAQEDTEVDAITPQCFALTPATWRRLRNEAAKIDPGPATLDTAKERRAHLVLAAGGLHGIATESARQREELTNIIVSTEELFRCSSVTKSAGSGPLLATRQFCFRLARAREGLVDAAIRAEMLRTSGIEVFRREVGAMRRFRDTGEDRPISEVVRRFPMSRPMLAAIDSIPENYACAVRREGEMIFCLDRDFVDDASKVAGQRATNHYIRDLSELPSISPLSEATAAFRGVRSDVAAIASDRDMPEDCMWCDPGCPHLNPSTTAAAASSSSSSESDSGLEGSSAIKGRLPSLKGGKRGRGVGTGISTRLRECVKQRLALERRLLRAAHKFTMVLENATRRTVIAIMNTTMLTPSAAGLQNWARFVTAARRLSVPMIVRAAAVTTDREAPLYYVPRGRARGLTVWWQSQINDQEIHFGLDVSGSIVRTFENVAVSRYATRGARLQFNTACGCGTDILFNTYVVNAVRKVVPTRTTMSPVCRCWTFSPTCEIEGMWSTYSQHFHYVYMFSAGNGLILAGQRDLNVPMTSELSELGRTRVVEIQVHQGDPNSAQNFERTDIGGIDYTVSWVSPVLFSHAADSWVAVLSEEGRYDEVWVPTEGARRVLADAGMATTKLHVVPMAIDTEHWHPTFGKNYSQPWWNAVGFQIGGKREYTPDQYNKQFNFKFLAQFRWQPAAGWDSLIKAYFAAFTVRDKVTLTIKTIYWPPAKTEGVADDRDGEAIVRAIVIHAAMLGYHDVKELPHFEVITEHLQDPELIGIYRAADAFVSVPHADGANIQLAQALSMAKPTIATMCSNADGYLNSTSAMVIPTQTVPIAPEVADMYGVRRSATWCEASHDDLVSAMRKMYEMPRAEREALGHRGRARFLETNSPETVADAVASRVQAIERSVRRRWFAGSALAAEASFTGLGGEGEPAVPNSINSNKAPTQAAAPAEDDDEQQEQQPQTSAPSKRKRTAKPALDARDGHGDGEW